MFSVYFHPVLGIRDILVRISGSAYPYLWLMDPDLAKDPTLFFSNFKDALYFFPTVPTATYCTVHDRWTFQYLGDTEMLCTETEHRTFFVLLYDLFLSLLCWASMMKSGEVWFYAARLPLILSKSSVDWKNNWSAYHLISRRSREV